MRVLRTIIILLSLFASVSAAQGQDIQDLIRECAFNAGEDATYLKDFVVKLDAANPGSKPPVFRQSLALRKNVIYRFSVCNLESSEGEAVLRVYDQANMILSTWYPESGKEYKSINFLCKKSGIYTIMINFKEGKAGEAIGILSYVDN
ncbi:MAG: hypothetical protein ACP5E3_04710 [Bacteroidales bacterium]